MPARRFSHLPVRFLLFFSVSLLPSCLPLDSPLSDPEKAKPDTRLFGVWRPMDEGGEKPKGQELAVLLIGKSRIRGASSGIMKMIWCFIDDKNDIGTQSLCFVPSLVGNKSYINIVIFNGTGLGGDIPASWDKRKIERYGLLKFKIEGDQLTFWGGDLNAAEAAIRKGQLKGRAKDTGWLKILPNITIAGGEDLSRFLMDGGDKLLFPEEQHKIEFTRIK